MFPVQLAPLYPILHNEQTALPEYYRQLVTVPFSQAAPVETIGIFPSIHFEQAVIEV